MIGTDTCAPRRAKTGCKHFIIVTCESGRYALGGIRQFAHTDAASCINACYSTGLCQAVDFNSLHNSCWHHTSTSACSALYSKPQCTHYKTRSCTGPLPTGLPALYDQYPGSHGLGGTQMPGTFSSLSLRQCVDACTASVGCQAVDYNSATRECWRHSSATACNSLNNKDSCTHVKITPCSGGITPSQCGVQAISPRSGRIVNGVEAIPHSWPWQVGLYDRLSNRFQCGGTLISEEWVLTAAHCFDTSDTPPATQMVVRVGDHSRVIYDSPESTHGVLQGIKHELYANENVGLGNDIALLQISPPATFNRYVGKICLPKAGTPFPPTSRCYAIGWGDTKSTGTPVVLRQVYLPPIDQATCSLPSNWGNTVTIIPSMMCGGFISGGFTTCQGDSGGPLMCNTGGRWVQAGITSFGYDGCNVLTKPPVFTRTSSFESWIESKTGINI